VDILVSGRGGLCRRVLHRFGAEWTTLESLAIGSLGALCARRYVYPVIWRSCVLLWLSAGDFDFGGHDGKLAL
jgi:hypothetical protein